MVIASSICIQFVIQIKHVIRRNTRKDRSLNLFSKSVLQQKEQTNSSKTTAKAKWTQVEKLIRVPQQKQYGNFTKKGKGRERTMLKFCIDETNSRSRPASKLTKC